MEEKKELCACCNAMGKHRCKQCNSICYCSSLCQEADWPIHELLCKSFNDFTSRPTPEHRRAILFPVDKSKPTFLWVKLIRNIEGNYYQVDADDLLRRGNEEYVITQQIYIEQSVSLNRGLNRGIVLLVRDAFLKDGSADNLSVDKLTGGVADYNWKGPILATGRKMRQLQVNWMDGPHEDLDTSDLKMIHDFFLDYGAEKIDPPQKATTEKVQGVIVHCDADMKARNKPRFEAIKVPVTHAVFSSDGQTQSSQIARRIGMPLLTRKMKREPSYTGSNGSKGITFLHRQVEDSDLMNIPPSRGIHPKLGWGWAPWYWQQDVKSAIVVREDRQPLSAKDLETLCSWCDDELQGLFQDAAEEVITREQVMERITPMGFQNYQESV